MSTQEKIEHIVNWLQSYKESIGVNGFVVGISGGIDSSVTSTLATMAGDTHVVNLPMAPKQIGAPRRHFEWLDEQFNPDNRDDIVTYSLAEVWKPFDAFMDIDINKMDAQETDPETLNLTKANLQARLRMAQLYFIANRENRLVVGTGNCVEDMGVGFFTKWGDGAVDLAPIADLYKSSVYEIGRELGLNNEILDAQPTDGLWEDGRTDEDQLGLTYDEIEDIMANGKSANVSMEKYNRYFDLHNGNRHKMNMPPVCELPNKEH